MLATEHYTYRPDGKIGFYTIGKGDPLVFLHNVELSSFIWRRLQDKFAEHFTCYLVDLPGHGISDVPAREYSLSDFSKAIVDVLDSAGIKETSFVGSHGGCHVAADIAVNNPRRVKKLVFDGLPFWNKERGRIVWEKAFIPGYTDMTSYDVPVGSYASHVEKLGKNPTPVQQQDHEYQMIITRTNPRWIRTAHKAITDYDVEAASANIKAPVLLLYGETDGQRRGEQRAVQGIKGSILKVIKQSPSLPYRGHGSHWSSPDFAELALDFLLDRR